MTTEKMADFLRGSNIADRTYFALKHYQNNNFDTEDRTAIQGGLDYISKVKIADDIAKGKITGRFSETGEELRQITYGAMREVRALQNNREAHLSLGTIEETLESVNAEKINREDLKIIMAILFFRRIRDVLQSKSSIPTETVNIQEHYW